MVGRQRLVGIHQAFQPLVKAVWSVGKGPLALQRLGKWAADQSAVVTYSALYPARHAKIKVCTNKIAQWRVQNVGNYYEGARTV